MDYQDEQNNEIEALDSIYCGDIEIIATEPRHKFIIPIKSERYEPDTENGLTCKLKFTYMPKYPEEIPEIEICDPENFEDGDEEALKEHIVQQVHPNLQILFDLIDMNLKSVFIFVDVIWNDPTFFGNYSCPMLVGKHIYNYISTTLEENLGTVMIFTLVSSAQEWLNTKWDEISKTREECALQKEKEAEEAERKRFEGTRVTVESFLAWKVKFDQEFNAKKYQEKEDQGAKKLTGRELFLTDKTLNESDLKFLEDGGDSIKVDESLFQDLEELELDGDETDEDCS